MSEQWLPVVGYLGTYEVSDLGRVRSLTRRVLHKDGKSSLRQGRVLSPGVLRNRGGYLVVNLQRAMCRVHRLVLQAFVGPCPEGHVGAHLDGDPANNCLENLAWKTPAENEEDKTRHGTRLLGEDHPNSVLTRKMVIEARARHRAGERICEIDRDYPVASSTLGRAIRGATWRSIPAPGGAE